MPEITQKNRALVIVWLPVVVYLCAFDAFPQTKIKIHPLGDSTTEAHELHTAWRYWIWKKWIDAGISETIDFVGSRQGTNNGTSFSDNDWDMDHDGHTGSSAYQILNGNLSYGHSGSIKVWAPLYVPDIALIYLGTNDIRQRRSVSAGAESIKGIITELRKANPAVKIIVCTIPYWQFSSFGGNAASVDSLNELIGNMVSFGTTMSPIKIVDLFTGYDLNDNRDGIHPGESGAKKIAERINSALLPWISPPASNSQITRVRTLESDIPGPIAGKMHFYRKNIARLLVHTASEQVFSLDGRSSRLRNHNPR